MQMHQHDGTSATTAALHTPSRSGQGARRPRRIGARVLITALLSVALLPVSLGLGASSVSAGEREGCGHRGDDGHRYAAYQCAKTGDLLDMRLGDLRATQAVLGYYEVYYKLGRYQYGKDVANGGFNKRFDDWCEANGQEKAASATDLSRLDDPSSFSCTVPVGSETAATIAPMKTAVIGPDGVPYLVDGHHTFTAFVESPDGGRNMHVRVRVLANLSRVEDHAFWNTMKANHWVWLQDENNNPITVRQLPKRLGLSQFHNDVYRGLVYFTRDSAYSQNADNANYQEFYWGSWLRTGPAGFDLSAVDVTDFAAYVAAASTAGHLMSGLAATDVVYAPFTAGDLGVISPFGAGEWAKTAKNYCQAKPGKIAYAFKYLGIATC
jgi:hypothetical protein